MSIAEFSAALKNKAIKDWFTSEKSSKRGEINNLVNPTSDYRSAEQTAEKTAFIITKDTVRSLLIDLKGITEPNILDSETDAVFKRFGTKGAGIRVNRRKINVGNGVPAVYFSNIAFDSITNLVNSILEINPRMLAEKYEKGHVVGLNTELLRVTTTRLMTEIDGRSAQGAVQAKNFLVKELEKVIEYYKRLDYDSANIQPAKDVPVYASVSKTLSRSGNTKYLVELQPKSQNQISAGEVKATIGSIRKLFTPGQLSERQMAATIDKLIKSVSDEKFAQDLLNMRSSPSYLSMLAKQFADTILGKAKDQVYNISNVKIGTQKIPKPNLTEVRKIANVEKAKAQKLVTKLKKSARPIPSKAISLLQLQNLINRQLQDVVSANMGDGNSRNVLNYRTGRLAGSAKVETMSQSRAGMITAFYSYMKNPYATFSEGGRQQNPKSRDPKLLISKSIREIAAQHVSNRLRAVNI